MVHGFDIPLSDHDGFERAAAKASRTLADLDINLHRVRTNLREALGGNWEDTFGSAIAAVLLMFQQSHRWGLIGSSEPYGNLVLPWGSTSGQDWMASSGRMEIRHDGAGASRSDKVAALVKWPGASSGLRVCWSGTEHDRNCGRCEKCIRTILNFKAVGADVPACFDRTPSSAEIRRLMLHNDPVAAEFRSILRAAADRGVDDSWMSDVEAMLRATARRKRRDNSSLRRALLKAQRTVHRS